MDQSSNCQQCGLALKSDTRAGLCPRCLVQAGIDLSTTAAVSAKAVSSADIAEALPCRLGDYELLERIARGGMGVVYRARQISLNRTVAVKMILAGELASLDTVQRFHAEAESVANLRHPNIVAIYETGEVDGQHYFSMEYIEGRNLAEMVQDHPLTAKRAAHYMQQVAEAVEYAHQHNILHRDLKPSNVLVDERDQARVTDFGLAKKLVHDSATDSALTLHGQLLGSPNFMPPEQASCKRGRVGPQSDVYGLGALLYHVLTGRPPFQAATLEETLHQVFELEPVSPRALNPGVPRDLDTICLKCLQKDPQRRYPTAQAVAEELGRFLRSEPIRARPVNPAGKAWRWCRRKPVLASLSAAVILLLLALAIGGPIVAEHYRQLSYASDITAAWQSWENGNITHSVKLLKRHRPWPGQSDLREFTWRYLSKLCLPVSETPLAQNPVPVFLSDVSRDGTRFATSGAYARIVIWDVETHQIECQIATGDHSPLCIAFSPDARLLVTAGSYMRSGTPRTLKVWEVKTGDKVFEKTELYGSSGQFSPDGRCFALGNRRGEIAVLDVTQNWQALRDWHAHKTGIWDIRWSPDGTKLVSAGEDHTAIIWDAVSEEELSRLEGHGLGVLSAAFSPDGQVLATASEDKTVRFWDAATGTEFTQDGYEHAADVYSVTWSSDGKWVASAGSDGLVKLRNLETHSDWTLRGHSQTVSCARFALNNNVLISASLDGTIRFWDLGQLPPNDALEGRAGGWNDSPLAFSPDSRIIATVDPDATQILLWDVATGALKSRFPIPASDMRKLLSPDEATIAKIEVDDLTFVSEDRLATACRIHLNTPGADVRHRIALYDLQSNALVNGFPGSAPIKLSPDGERLAMGSEAPGTVQIRDLASGEVCVQADMDRIMGSPTLWALAFSPQGNTLAVAGGTQGKHELVLLRAATGELLAPLESHSLRTPSFAIAFTPDGDRLISGGFKIQVWDVHGCKFAFELPGHASMLQSLAVCGKTLVTGSEAGVLKFWSLKQLEQKAPLLTLRAHAGSVNGLCFAPNGNTLASGSKQGKVRLWRAVPEP